MARDLGGGGGGGMLDWYDRKMQNAGARGGSTSFGSGPPPISSSGSGSGQRSSNRRSPIGVEDDYFVVTGESVQGRQPTDGRPGMQLGGGQMAQRSYTSPITRSPSYYDGDQDIPGSFTPDKVMELQQSLAKAGLLSGNFTLGYFDPTTRTAYERLLGMANRAGMDADQLLNEMLSGAAAGGGGTWSVDEFGNIVREGGPGGQELPPLVTRTTDPAILKQVFRRSVIDLLGEGWTQQQIDGMASAYNQMEQERQKAAYDLQLTGGSYVDIPSPDAWIEAQVAERDPAGMQKAEAMNLMGDTLGALADTAWGVG